LKRPPKDHFPRGIPYHRFKEFIALEADRFAVLKTLLDEVHVSYTVITIKGNRHFFVYMERQVASNSALTVLGCPPELMLQNMLAKSCIDTVLVSHYDRTPGSPGANDNSAAVFELLKAGLMLKSEGLDRWLIIFTDKEELSAGDSLLDQGSYTLAKWLKDACLDKAQIFIFDCCGVGDTLIISTAVDHLLRNDDSSGITRSRYLVSQMRERALKTARNIRLERVLLVPTPFSDDAGFFRAGLAAQTITVLPAIEAARLASLLRTRPDFADALVSKDVQDVLEKAFIPETWLSINGPNDCYEQLTPQYFQRLVDFAYALVER
jgi:hypothetical protein